MEVKVKVMEYNIHNSMVNINLYKSHTWAYFASFHDFQDIVNSKFVIFKM